MKRTFVYMDGFNLYYRALRKTKFKWLNLEALVQGLLHPNNVIEKIRYFTAPVSGKTRSRTADSATAVSGCAEDSPKCRDPSRQLPDDAQVPAAGSSSCGGPTHAEIWSTEEKGSDVNLATYLVHDAWRNLFDVAVVLSQDTDLIEPVRIVREEIGKPIGVVCLDGRAAGTLANQGTFVRHITPARLSAAQFPETLTFGRRGKTVSRPPEWI